MRAHGVALFEGLNVSASGKEQTNQMSIREE